MCVVGHVCVCYWYNAAAAKTERVLYETAGKKLKSNLFWKHVYVQIQNI